MLAEALRRLMVAPVPGRSCKEQEKYRSAVVLTGTSLPFHENISPPEGVKDSRRIGRMRDAALHPKRFCQRWLLRQEMQ